MGVFLTIFKNDLRLMVKDVKALLLLLVMPVIVILVFARALAPLMEKTSFLEPFTMALVDQEGSMWTDLLKAQLTNLGITDSIPDVSEDEAREMIAKGEAAAAIVIPDNLSHSIDYWEPAQGKVLGSSSLYLESRLVNHIALVGSTAVSSGLAALNAIYDYEQAAGFDKDTLYKEIVLANEAFIQVILDRKGLFAEDSLEATEVDPIAYYAVSLLAIFILFNAIPAIKMLAGERQMGILSRISAAPARPWQLICSKLLLSVLLSVVQFSIIAVLMSLAVKVSWNQSTLWVILLFLATALASAAFSLLLAAVVRSVSSIDLIANLSILLMAVAGGSIYPLSSLPEASRIFSVLTINRWTQEGFVAVLFSQDASAAGRSLMMLLLLTLGYLAAAVVCMGAGRRRVAS